jgi:membrane-bound serine protease (ClpP class)
METFKPGETVEIASITDLTLMVRRRPALSAGEGGVR